MDGFRYHVFLSHASSDKPAVEELALWLMREGLTPFLDKWNLVPGEDWTDALPAALAASRTCAVVIGPGDKGGWQTEEVKQSLLRRVRERVREAGDRFRIIPVLLPGASAPGAGEPSAFDFLAESTWVKFDKTLDEEAARHRLACGIKGISPGLGPGVMVMTGECPYRGLAVFDVAHAKLFFGREKLTRDLVEMLGAALRGPGPRLLAVVGASGSGKSSIVRAGLIPVLAQGALEGSETWKRLIFKPGQDPFESLGIALTTLPGGAVLLAETRRFLGIERFGRDHDRSLHTAALLATRDDPPPARLLVVVDQFEEVFTQCGPEDDRRKLIANLIEAATVPNGPVVVILSLRADFLGKCAAYRTLADAVSGRQKLIGAMSEDELRWAIEKPAALAGGEIEPGLVDQLLRDVGEDPGMLPLLEFALTQLWRQKTGRRMTAEDYRAIGGLRGALKQHAEGVRDGLRLRGLEDIGRRVFLDLIEPGKGTADTRRRVPKAQVAVSAEWTEVVETLVRERLVTTGQKDDAGVNTIEIVHESLIKNWTTLQGWVDADRKSIEERSELQAAADRWVNRGHHPDYLLNGLPLANALEWAKTHAEDVARLAPIRLFLDESEAAERRSRDDALAREREQRRAAEAAARKQRTLSHWLMFAAGVALMLAVAAGFLTRSARQNESQAIENEKRAVRNAYNGGLAAVEATWRDDQRAAVRMLDDPLLFPQRLHEFAWKYLRRRVGMLAQVGPLPRPERPELLAVAPGPEVRIAWVDSGGKIWTFGPDLNGIPRELIVASGPTSLGFSYDGQWLIWTSKGQLPQRSRMGEKAEASDIAHEPLRQATALSVSRAGPFIFWSDGAAIHRFSYESGKALPPIRIDAIKVGERITELVSSYDGNTVVAGHGERFTVIHLGPDAKQITHEGRCLHVSHDGRSFVLETANSTIGLLVEDSGSKLNPILTLKRATGVLIGPFPPAFSPDDTIFAAGIPIVDNPFEVQIWQVPTGRVLKTMTGDRYPLGVEELPLTRFAAGGNVLITWSNLGTLASPAPGYLKLWETATDGVKLPAVPDWAVKSEVSARGTGIKGPATLEVMDGRIVLRSATAVGAPIAKPITNPVKSVLTAAHSLDGNWLACIGGTTGSRRTTHLGRLPRSNDGETAWVLLLGDLDEPATLAFSPDSRRLAIGGYRGSGAMGQLRGFIEIWEVGGKSDAKVVASMDAEYGSVTGLAYSPDGLTLASVSEGLGGIIGRRVIRLWDPVTGQLRYAIRNPEIHGNELVFSPDSEQLVFCSGEKKVLLWDGRLGSLPTRAVSSVTYPATK